MNYLLHDWAQQTRLLQDEIELERKQTWVLSGSKGLAMIFLKTSLVIVSIISFSFLLVFWLNKFTHFQSFFQNLLLDTILPYVN